MLQRSQMQISFLNSWQRLAHCRGGLDGSYVATFTKHLA